MVEMKPPVGFEQWIVKWIVLPAFAGVVLFAIVIDGRSFLSCRHLCLSHGSSDYHFVLGGRSRPDVCNCITHPLAEPNGR